MALDEIVVALGVAAEGRKAERANARSRAVESVSSLGVVVLFRQVGRLARPRRAELRRVGRFADPREAERTDAGRLVELVFLLVVLFAPSPAEGEDLLAPRGAFFVRDDALAVVIIAIGAFGVVAEPEDFGAPSAAKVLVVIIVAIVTITIIIAIVTIVAARPNLSPSSSPLISEPSCIHSKASEFQAKTRPCPDAPAER